MSLELWLAKMIEHQASDLFITVGVPPTAKTYGELLPLAERKLSVKETEDLIFGIMTPEQKETFFKTKELNFAIQIESLGRFRVNVFQQRSQVGAVFRHIKTVIPTLAELKLPEILSEFALIQRGLIIIVGATGSGKSTTLAAMVGYRNKMTKGHIVTIEDPIEYLYEHQNCIITQREVDMDTESFEVALKNTLRQAPDVILIGEIRTRETMNYAIAFAETGHLCLATLHANNANQALDRILSFFPREGQSQLWMDLSLNLKAIVGEQLIPMKGGAGRIPAVEILINTPVIADHIRKGDVHLLKEFMTKSTEMGMQTFDQSLYKLYTENKISYESALRFADSQNDLRLLIKLNKGPTSAQGLNIADDP